MNHLRPALLMLVAISVLTGIVYPLLVTAAARLFFPAQAEGSLINIDGHCIGSELIGQPFQKAGYFWSRPSATSPSPYNAAASSGSNLGPTNPVLFDRMKATVKALKELDPSNTNEIPIDLVTASASGLDPHISPQAALYQLPRVARIRAINPGGLERIVQAYTESRYLGILGEARVNVLKLNLALDKMFGRPRE